MSDDSNGAYNPTTGIWTIDSLTNGQMSILHIIAQAIVSNTQINNTATIINNTYDPNTINNQANVIIEAYTPNTPNTPTNPKIQEIQILTPEIPILLTLQKKQIPFQCYQQEFQ